MFLTTKEQHFPKSINFPYELYTNILFLLLSDGERWLHCG